MHFDVFNGDADGICALLQLRQTFPCDSKLVTGVKREIDLLRHVSVNDGAGTDFAFVVTDYAGNTVSAGGNDYNGPGCFDIDGGCYTISLSSSSGGGQGSASLSIGDEIFEWNDGSGGFCFKWACVWFYGVNICFFKTYFFN